MSTLTAERRRAPRFVPTHAVRALFRHATRSKAHMGRVTNLSYRGVCVHAPPHVRTGLEFGDAVHIVCGAPEAGLSGLTLRGHVVRLDASREGTWVHVATDAPPAEEEAILSEYILQLARGGYEPGQ